MQPPATELREGYADLADVRLHYVEAGSGPLVLMLHGFPDFSYSWRHQLPALAGAGFRVVAPDLRGYNRSDKPGGVANYRLELLCRDVEQLIGALGEKRAAVVGHDWGGAVAWSFAMHNPALLSRLAILNLPHPQQMAAGLRTWRQLRRSWYMFFFQLPWLPEALIRRGDHALLRSVFRNDPRRPGAFTGADIERYVDAAAQPGALTAMINYYRALFRYGRSDPYSRLAPIAAPVLVIWGERDRYLAPWLAAPDPRWVPDARLVRLPEASHWVQHDEPERVNELLLEFLAPLLQSDPPHPDTEPYWSATDRHRPATDVH